MIAGGLAVSRQGRILQVVIRRGDGNRFTTEMTRALADAVRDAEADPELSFVRLCAEGDSFCLGREREGDSADELRVVSGRIVELIEVLRESPLIVVCEVGGGAAGFGVGLVASSDIAIASESAEFWFPELEAGLAPAVVLSWLVRLVPRKRAFELVAGGRRMSAAEAADCGLVTETAAAGEVSATADGWLQRLAAVDNRALRDVKSFLLRAESLDERAAGRAAADLLALGSLRTPGPP